MGTQCMKIYIRVGALYSFKILVFFSSKLSCNQFLITSTVDKYYEDHVEFKMNILILLSILTPKWLYRKYKWYNRIKQKLKYNAWVSFRSWWWTGKSGVLQSMGLQRVRHDWATELNWKHNAIIIVRNINVLTVASSARIWTSSWIMYVLFSPYTWSLDILILLKFQLPPYREDTQH